MVLVIGVAPDGGVGDAWSSGAVLRPYIVLGALEAMKKRFMEREIEW